MEYIPNTQILNIIFIMDNFGHDNIGQRPRKDQKK